MNIVSGIPLKLWNLTIKKDNVLHYLVLHFPHCAREACAPAYRLKGDATGVNKTIELSFEIEPIIRYQTNDLIT